MSKSLLINITFCTPFKKTNPEIFFIALKNLQFHPLIKNREEKEEKAGTFLFDVS